MQHTLSTTADGQEPQDRTRLNTNKTADSQELQDRTRLSRNKTADSLELQDRTRLSTDKTADSQELQDRTTQSAQQMRLDRHCDSCAVCKHHAANRPLSIPDESRAKRPLEVIHMDLRGPHTAGINQELYHLLIVDEYTHYVVGFTLKRKSDTLACFERFATAANNFHSAKGYSIKFIRTHTRPRQAGRKGNAMHIRRLPTRLLSNVLTVG